MSHAELAKRAGVARATLASMLADRYYPRRVNLEAVAGALKVLPAALEDDVACMRTLCEIHDVPLSSLAGRPHPDLDKLLDDVGPERERGVLDLVRGMLSLTSKNQEPPLRAAEPTESPPPNQAHSSANGRRRRRND